MKKLIENIKIQILFIILPVVAPSLLAPSTFASTVNSWSISPSFSTRSATHRSRFDMQNIINIIIKITSQT